MVLHCMLWSKHKAGHRAKAAFEGCTDIHDIHGYQDSRSLGEALLGQHGEVRYKLHKGKGWRGILYWRKAACKGEDTLVRGPFEVLFDMVVLAVGIEPGEGTRQISKVLGLNVNEYGFLAPRIPNVHFDSGKDGIYLAGTCVAPMSV